MSQWMEFFFGPAAYGPGSARLAEQPGLVAVYALSDGLLAFSYFVIPAALAVALRGSPDASKHTRLLGILFIIFIAACGATHLTALVTLWSPIYGVLGLVKAAAAVVSAAAAIMIWPLLPRMLARPADERLQREVAAHRRTMDELRVAQQELEGRVARRTRELGETQHRFEIALRGSPITTFSQDRDLRYTWIHNPPKGFEADKVLGRTDREILPPDTADKIIALKRAVIQSGAPKTMEVALSTEVDERTYQLTIEPLNDEAGDVAGVISVAVDITEGKRSEDHLRKLLRELTHRSKNLLAVIQSIARQTAHSSVSMEDFLSRFGARLQAIGSAHDLLVHDNWTGAGMRNLVKHQLAPYADRIGSQIIIDGEDLVVKPTATQNIGLAIHELAMNAGKYGALSTGDGQVHIKWAVERGDQPRLRLVWEESGGPEFKPPEHMGFGRTMIERVVGQVLEGDVNLDFLEKGVLCTIEIPANHIVDSPVRSVFPTA